MREIKFRAWDGKQKEMVCQEQCFPFTLITQYGLFRLDPHQEINNYQKIDREYILMQYTGLKDKNGKEIYEGDVVQWDNNGYNCVNVIKWCENGFWLTSKEGERHLPYNMQVIGNIYENPELLTKKS